MPDGDYLAWRAGARWRKVANLLKSGASSVEIEDALASAVANSIRASGGVPRFSAVVDTVRQAAAIGDGQSAVIAIPSSSRDGVVGRLLDEAARALVATMQTGMNLVSPMAATELLADRLLDRIAMAGLDHMVPELIAEGHYTMPQLRELLARLSDSKPMATLRDRFIRHPSGEGLRAPARRTPAKPLGELLNTGLDDL
jgi:hypothetical protein